MGKSLRLQKIITLFLLISLSLFISTCATTNSARENLKKALILKDFELAQYYIDIGADVNKTTISYLPLFADALLRGDEELVQFLLKNNADVNLITYQGIPTFFYIFKSNANEEVKYRIFKMLYKKANLSLTDKAGNNAAHYAIKYEIKPIIYFLFRTQKELFYKKNNTGITPLDLLKIKQTKDNRLKDIKL